MKINNFRKNKLADKDVSWLKNKPHFMRSFAKKLTFGLAAIALLNVGNTNAQCTSLELENQYCPSGATTSLNLFTCGEGTATFSGAELEAAFDISNPPGTCGSLTVTLQSFEGNFGDSNSSFTENSGSTTTDGLPSTYTGQVLISDGVVNHTCPVEVNIESDDQDAPDAQCVTTDVMAHLNSFGFVILSASALDGGSTDDCTEPSDLVFTESGSATFILDCNNLGDNAITLEVTDESINGAATNTTTCAANVVVVDTILPMAVCLDDFTFIGGTVYTGDVINAGDLDNGSTDNDNCNGLTYDVTTQPVAPFPGDSSSITVDCSTEILTLYLWVTDFSGNQSLSCATTVYVEDDDDPVSNVVNPFTIDLDVDGSYTLMASQLDSLSSDNCGIEHYDITVMIPPAANFIPGSSPSVDVDCSFIGAAVNFILTVTDTAGNSSSNSVAIEFFDVTNPVANCQPAVISLDPLLGTYTLLPNEVNANSSDNCGIVSMRIAPNSFDCADVGTTVDVTLTVMDAAGQSDNCTTTVTIIDLNAPTGEVVYNNTNAELLEDRTSCDTLTSYDLDGEGTSYFVNGSDNFGGICAADAEAFVTGCYSWDTLVQFMIDRNFYTDACGIDAFTLNSTEMVGDDCEWNVIFSFDVTDLNGITLFNETFVFSGENEEGIVSTVPLYSFQTDGVTLDTIEAGSSLFDDFNETPFGTPGPNNDYEHLVMDTGLVGCMSEAVTLAAFDSTEIASFFNSCDQTIFVSRLVPGGGPNAGIPLEPTLQGDDCNWQLTYQVVITDGCDLTNGPDGLGHNENHTYRNFFIVYTGSDQTDPWFDNFPEDAVLECSKSCFDDPSCNANYSGSDPVAADLSTIANGIPTPVDDCASGAGLSLTYLDVWLENTATICLGDGTLTRTWTVTDSCGLVYSQDQVITISDTDGPVIGVVDDIPVNTSGGDCSALVFFEIPTIEDDCSGTYESFTIDVSPEVTLQNISLALTDLEPGDIAGGTFSFGTTTITITAWDCAGNESDFAYEIVVTDPSGTCDLANCPVALVFNSSNPLDGGAVESAEISISVDEGITVPTNGTGDVTAKAGSYIDLNDVFINPTSGESVLFEGETCQ